MEPEVAERILTCGSNLVLEKEGFIPLQVAGEGYSLSHQEDGVCHFYQDDLCELHRAHGLSHKPVVCQLYPFTLVKTPRGIFVSLLYSCPAVVAGLGAGRAEQEEALTQLLLLRGGDVPQIHVSELLLTTGTKLSWPDYLEIEHKLLGLVDGSDPVGSLLHMMDFLLPGTGIEELSRQLVEVARLVRADLSVDEDEMTEFCILKPATTIDRECIRRFLLHQIRGKLLLIGPTLVSRLLNYAVGLAVFLDVLEKKRRRSQALHFSFDDLHESFEFLEEKVLARSPELESHLLVWEEQLERSC